MHLDIRNVSIAYPPNPPVVRQVDLKLAVGEIGCLLGRSGCGKTTLLRAIAGFEPLQDGEIHLHNRLVSRSGYRLPPEQRRVGMVFQDLALFPHLSVADNIAFGLRDFDRGQRRLRVEELLQLVGLEHAVDSYPHQLSGGQQQRVALARAMAPRPDLLLLDEPFSSLDTELRQKLASEVRQILKADGLTALLVTHDQFEAFAMADAIGVMYSGRLLQWDSAYNLYHRPTARFVADFIGQGVMLPGTVVQQGEVATELGVLHGRTPAGCGPGCSVEVLIRPDDVLHDDHGPGKAEIVGKDFRGADYLYTLRLLSGAKVLCLAPSHHDHEVGHSLNIRVDVNDLVIFLPEPESTMEA